tara:strand:- start:2850 stop:3155 length:306 start_codon:yes stop_codon:yes gene_type:complete
MILSDTAGSILCMQGDNPQWSLARVNEAGAVIKLIEKRAPTNLANFRVYFFRTGETFKTAGLTQIKRNVCVNGRSILGTQMTSRLPKAQKWKCAILAQLVR